MMSPSKKILVLGLGNDLYGDDGIGLHAVRKIRKELEAEKGNNPGAAEVHCAESLLTGIALLDVIAGYDAIVIVDVIKQQAPVTGRIHLLEGTSLRDIPGPSPHYVSVPQMMRIGRDLGLKVPNLVKVIAVEAKNIYHLGEGLSEDMAGCLPDIIQKIKDVLKDIA
jgi:hydrogenase maturation protease